MVKARKERRWARVATAVALCLPCSSFVIPLHAADIAQAKSSLASLPPMRAQSQLNREVQPVPPRVLNPGIPKVLEDIILKVLSKEPSARYRTADQLGRLLVGLQAMKSGSAQPQVVTTPGASAVPAQTAPAPVPAPPDIPVYQTLPEALETDTAEKKSPDWGTLLLWLIAGAAMFGLIPFWLYVYLTLRP